jgi:hypothetical protein
MLEDRYNLLISLPKCFLNIVNSAQRLAQRNSSEISIEAIMLIEYVKEFYMNFPLRGQKPTATCSMYTENEFLSITKENIKEHHCSSIEEEDNFEQSEVKKYLGLEEIQDKESDMCKTIYFGYGNDTIISISQAPYSMSKVIIRNLTGLHGWLLTKHKVLDYDCLRTIDYNDKLAVYKNVLAIKGDSTLKDIIDGVKSSSDIKGEKLNDRIDEILRIIPKDESKKIEEELKEVQNSNALINVISVLAKHYKSMKIVLVLITK